MTIFGGTFKKSISSSLARRVRLLAAVSLGLLPVLLLPASAFAIDEFPLPNPGSDPAGITVGPDGALWFTEENANGNRIGRITTSGSITEYPIPSTSSLPAEIITGPDGKLWFTEFGRGKIGRLDPANPSSIDEFPTPTIGSGPDGITVGPDGMIWFTEFQQNKIGRLDPANPSSIDEFPIPTPASGPSDIATGPDGRLWFTEANPGINQIGAIETDGSPIAEYSVPTPGSDPSGITSSGGALWFTESGKGQIGRITTVGGVTEFGPTGSDPSGITTGPDGALWFTESAADSNRIGRITAAGSISAFPIPTPSSEPSEITAGPDGALWFTEKMGNKIGRIATAAAVDPGGAPPPPPPAAPLPRLPVAPPTGSSPTRRACRVPKVRRLTVRKAKKKLRRAGCRFRIRGKGRVLSTKPRAGTRTTKVIQVKTKRKRR